MTIEIKDGKVYGKVKYNWSTRLNGEKGTDGKFVHESIKMNRIVIFDGMPQQQMEELLGRELIVRRQKNEREMGDLEAIAEENGTEIHWSQMGIKIVDPEEQFNQTLANSKSLTAEQKAKLIEELMK